MALLAATRARPTVVVEEGPDGLRAKQFDEHADVAHWEELWSATSVDYSSAERGHPPHQLRTALSDLRGPPARVLEAGCGLGHFTVAMHAQGYDAAGVDWALGTVKRLSERFPRIKFRQRDVRSLPDVEGSFDAVYSPGVCEHFEEGPVPVLQEAFRILRPGGLAVVSTPCLNRLRERTWRDNSASGGASFYQYLFTPSGMTRTLERIGFCDVVSRPYAVWSTLSLEWPFLSRLPLGRTAGLLDVIPLVQQLGASCIWTARKPEVIGGD